MTRGMIGLMMLVEVKDSEGGCNCAKVVVGVAVVVVVVVKGVIVGGVVLVLFPFPCPFLFFVLF